MTFIQLRKKRLQELKNIRPQFAEIFDFYIKLYSFLEEEKEPFLTVSPSHEDHAIRQGEGFPLLSGDSLQVDTGKALSFLQGLIDVLKENGQQGKAELASLREALAAEELKIAALFRACLDKDRRILDEQAQQANVSPALVEYLFATALSFALQQAGERGLSVNTEGWTHGYCPLCGGLPVMGEHSGEEGKMKLHCGTCATAWSFPRITCAYCGNDDRETIEYFTAESEVGYRVDICRKCSCYLKTADCRELGDGHPMDIEDFSTLHLDILAQKEGFTKGKKLQV